MRPVIAFDMDGVLVDSQALILESLDVALAAIGQGPIDPEDRGRIVGPPLRSMLELVLGESATEAEFAACTDAYRQHNDAHGPTRTPIFPGITEVLTELQNAATLIVVTSKRETSARSVISGAGLSPFFTAVYGSLSDSTVESKSQTLGRAMADFPGTAMLIGDRHHDVSAAIGAGVHPVAVLWGYGSRAELEDAGALHFADRPDELVSVVSSLLG